MKKLLSLVLVLVMVLGLTVPAFAAGTGVTINGTEIESAGTVTNGAITAGTVTFTDSTPKKLTLNNATITENAAYPAIMSSTPLEIELAGDNTVTGTMGVAAIMLGSGNLTFSGTGTLIAHGSGGDASPAIVVTSGTVTLPEGYKAVGSTSTTETDISKMSDATFSTENHTFMVGGEKAQTVAIYNPNATAEESKSDSTTITATVAVPKLEYEIVIPDAVTMTKAGVVEIGAATINMEEGKLKNATANTVISYTASGTNFTLKDGDATMPAKYYSEYTKEGDQLISYTELTTESFVVYQNSALVNPLTKLYVGVTQAAWDAAAQNNPGTYTASVTFNFTAEEAEPAVAVTAADALVTGAQFRLTGISNADNKTMVGTFENTGSDVTLVSFAEDGTVYDPEDNFSFILANGLFIFNFDNLQYSNSLIVKIDLNNNNYENTQGTFTRFEVKPAGATEFTEVTLAQA